MKIKNRFSIFLLAILICSSFLFAQKIQAMPVGTLLYRTSADGQMYGYNTDKILDGARVNCGHAGIYVGDNKVLEAVNRGVVLNDLKYFVNTARKEEFLGARIPLKYSNFLNQKIKKIASFLVSQEFQYDKDFAQQKGSKSGEWTCVGLTEKIYESLDFGNDISNIGDLEYEPEKYYIDITPDGFENNNIYNQELGDHLALNKEFSKINKRKGLLGLAGNGLGRAEEDDNYFFFPYTQFKQETLKDVEVDVSTLSSSFTDKKIRGGAIAIATLSQGIKNNAGGSIKTSAMKVKNAFVKAGGAIKNTFARAGSIFKKKETDNKLVENINAGRVLSETNKDSQEIVKKTAEEVQEKVLGIKKEIEGKIKEIEKKTEQVKNLVQEKVKIGLKESAVNIEKLFLQGEKVELERVIDGDTILLTNGERVRYIGIDAPELKKEGKKDDECLAWEARYRNLQLLKIGDLRLVKDRKVDRDKYGRLLRYVYIGDVFVNKVLVKEGFAEPFFCKEGWSNCPVTGDIKKQSEIMDASLSARLNKRGPFSNICEELKQKIKNDDQAFWKKKEELTKENLEKKEKQKINPILFHNFSSKPKQEVEIVKIEISTSTASSTQTNVASGTEDIASSTETVIDPEIDEPNLIPEILDFYLFDLNTGSKIYTSSSTVGVFAEYLYKDEISKYDFADELKIASILSLDLASLEVGEQIISLKIFDYISSTSVDMATSSIFYDDISPQVSLLSLGDEYDNDFEVLWTGMDNESELVSIEIEYQVDFNASTSEEWIFFASSSASSSKIFTADFFEKKYVFFRARAYDMAGNVSDYDYQTTIFEQEISEPLVNLLISEFATRGKNAYDEFVEIYNPTANDIDITGFVLQSQASASSSKWMSRVDDGFESGIVLAWGYFLISAKGYARDVEPDYRHRVNWGFSDSGGALRLLDSYQRVVDAVSHLDVDVLSASGSLERKAVSSSTSETMRDLHRLLGNSYDTDSDSDFVERTVPGPQNKASNMEIKGEKIDQSTENCRHIWPLGAIFSQTFVPEQDNLSAVSWFFGDETVPDIAEVLGMRLCSGEMVSHKFNNPYLDWDCDNPGQELIAEAEFPQEVLAGAQRTLAWRKFNLGNNHLEVGENHFIMIKGKHLNFCTTREYDDYLSGYAGGADVGDFLFRTYYIDN